MNEQQHQTQQIDFADAANRFFVGVESVTPVDGSYDLAKIETAFGAFALRRWPRGTTSERVNVVHGVLGAANGLTFIPQLATAKNDKKILQIEQSIFDATNWIEGRPLRRPEAVQRLGRSVPLPRNASTQTIDELAAGIARFHEASSQLVTKRGTPSLPPGRLIAISRDSWLNQRTRLRPIAGVTPDIQRWIRTGERALPLAEKIIGTLAEDDSPKLAISHANLWPEHVLVKRESGQERLVGLVDFRDVIASTPLLDLAQIASRFNGWSEESAEQVIGAYGEGARLSPVERRVLPAVAALDLVAETGRVLIVLHVELGSPNASESLRDASDAMLRSLEAVTKTLERLEGVNQPGPRKWVHRTPPPGKSPRPRTSEGSRPKRPAKPKQPRGS